jgi:uncharacterized membrane protein
VNEDAMSNNIITNAISAIIALSLAGAGTSSFAESAQASNGQDMMLSPPAQGMERCYGVAKVGQNNCGNANHGCAGEASVSGNKSDWIFVPDGLCKKIVGGSLTPENKS